MNQRFRCCKTIDVASLKINNAIINNVITNNWNEVFRRIAAITKMVGKSGLAFQGTSDKLFEYNNVIFLNR